MNKRKKVANKKHRKNKNRLKELKRISLKLKKDTKKITTPKTEIKETPKKEPVKKAATKKEPAKKAVTKKKPATKK